MNLRIFIMVLISTCLFACKTDNKKSAETNKEQADATKPEAIKKEDPILEIKNDFQHIESRLSLLKKKSASIYEGSPHPTELTGFYDGNALVKIVRDDISEHNSQTTSYYFKDGKLFFVFEEKGYEAYIQGPFTSRETRTYINEGELIKLLEKEKTFKAAEKVDISKVPNKDVLNETQNKSDLVNKYKSACTQIISQLKDRKSDGRWVSTDDPKSGIEIKNGKWITFYKGQKSSANDIFDYKITTKSTPDRKTTKHLTLTNGGDKMEYTILEDSEETLSLSYLERGNTLTYKKEK